MKGIVIYDSWTGNTKKVAEAIALVAGFDIVKAVDASLDLTGYELLVIGTPDIRAKPTEKIADYLSKVNLPAKHALFVTFGAPVWGQISSILCLRKMKKQLEGSNSEFIGKFMCPGFHHKFKTYKDRPSAKDLLRAQRFGKMISMQR